MDLRLFMAFRQNGSIMTTEDASLSWDKVGVEWQAKPADYQIDLPENPIDFDSLTGKCGKSVFACVCGTGGGFLASHIGCIVSPALAFMGAASGASVSLVSVAASTALTGIGMSIWYKTRGSVAGKLERNITIGGACAGAFLAAGMHLTGLLGHDHNMDEALGWYRAQPETMQAEIRQNARLTKMSLNDYVLQICGPSGELQENSNFRSVFRLDK